YQFAIVAWRTLRRPELLQEIFSAAVNAVPGWDLACWRRHARSPAEDHDTLPRARLGRKRAAGRALQRQWRRSGHRMGGEVFIRAELIAGEIGSGRTLTQAAGRTQQQQEPPEPARRSVTHSLLLISYPEAHIAIRPVCMLSSAVYKDIRDA